MISLMKIASAKLAMIQALKNMGRLEGGDKVGFSALAWSTNIMTPEAASTGCGAAC